MKEKISIIRMLSGAEIVGVIIGDGTDQIKLKNPVAVQFQQTQNSGEVAIAFGHLTPFSKKVKDQDEIISINSYLVEFNYEPNEQIAEQYLAYMQPKTSSLILPNDLGKIITPK